MNNGTIRHKIFPLANLFLEVLNVGWLVCRCMLHFHLFIMPNTVFSQRIDIDLKHYFGLSLLFIYYYIGAFCETLYWIIQATRQTPIKVGGMLLNAVSAALRMEDVLLCLLGHYTHAKHCLSKVSLVAVF